MHPATTAVRQALGTTAARLAVPVTDQQLDMLTTAAISAANIHVPRAPFPGSPLTVREVSILAAVARGLNNAEIGREFGLSPLTAKSHLLRIGDRLGCGERAGMVGIAYREGWLGWLPIEPRTPADLSRREQDVLRGMSQGLTNREIGRRLGLAEDTVKTAARKLFRSLRTGDRAHAVALGYQHGHLAVLTAPQAAAA